MTAFTVVRWTPTIRQCLLRELNPIARAILDVEQPASGTLRDPMEGVAGHRLHDGRKQVIRVAAEEIADEVGTAFGVLQRLHGHP